MAVGHLPLKVEKSGKAKASGKNRSGTLIRNLSALVRHSCPAISFVWPGFRGTVSFFGFFAPGCFSSTFTGVAFSALSSVVAVSADFSSGANATVLMGAVAAAAEDFGGCFTLR